MNRAIILLCGLVLVCCTSKEDEIDLLYNDVIAIHDEVMPRMYEIQQLQLSFDQATKSQQEGDSISTNISIDSLRIHLARLEQADEAMMNWMRNFESAYEGWPEDSILRYLQREKVKMQEVADLFHSTIDDAIALGLQPQGL